jgi:hypothetical protein
MSPVFESQAGQDRFVYGIAVAGEGRTSGTFLDIGCNDPVMRNNTYALEQAGWTGLLIDCEPLWAAAIKEKRRSPFVCGNAENIDWSLVLARHRMPITIDYLSFDVDGAGLTALKTLPWSSVRFRILTVEHDAYRFGDAVRQAMRVLLRQRKYELLCPDVMDAGCAFEDWYVDPLAVDMAVADRFRTDGATDWKSIVGL